MAEHVIETKIQLRYDDYSNWMNSDLILKRGEAAIAVFPYSRTITNSNDTPANTPPAIGIKIGDGVNPFYRLPWVQAIAADVYSWAKSADKPEYTASEIQGLASYIESHTGGSSGGGSTTVAPRLYQLVQGTNENANKYYLQYKEAGSNEWVTDINTYIDLNNLVKLVNWIGPDLTDYSSLGDRTEDHITTDFLRLRYKDNETAGQFVTAVSQTSGKISVTKKEISFNDITGTVPISKGGTGASSFTEGNVLIGNGQNTISTLAIDTDVENTNHLVTNAAVKRYIDNATAGLEGAMHFIGDATVAPVGSANPQIADYNFGRAQPGDVVLWEQKEYVWTGGSWRLLGDEGSYAIKGSIKNADIDAEADIDQSKIHNLIEDLANKVDKENDKDLMTLEERSKLSNIEEGANVNIIESISLNDTIQPINNKNVNLTVKEFDDASRLKLSTIAEGANVNTIESIYFNGTAVIPTTEKRIDLNETILGIQVDGQLITPDANKIVSILTNPHEDHINKIERITYDGQEVTVDAATKTAAILSNPHTEHINVIEGIRINDGQPLTPDANKIVTITIDPHTEHENVIEEININGVKQDPDNNKAVNITLNYIEGAEVPNKSGGTTTINTINKKLQLATIANSGDIKDLIQTNNTYILINCGSSTDVID